MRAPVATPYATFSDVEDQNMSRPIPPARLFKRAVPLVVILTLCTFVWTYRANGQGERSRVSTPEQETARYFESIRKSPPQLLAFLIQMPKEIGRASCRERV